MEDINYPTAYTVHGIKKCTEHDMFGLPIFDTECYVVMPCYITKHITRYDYDGKIHQEYEVIPMKKQTGEDFVEKEDIIFEEPQTVGFVTEDYELAKIGCELENRKLLSNLYYKVPIEELTQFREEFRKRQEILQDKVNGSNMLLKKSRKDYNE